MRRNLRTRREWPGITMMLAAGVVAMFIAADQDADARAARSTVPPVSVVVVPAGPAGGSAGVLHTHR